MHKIILAVAATVASAAASITFYTDKTAFTSATTTKSTIDFEGIAPAGGFSDFSTAAGLTLGGVTFVGPRTSVSIPNPPVHDFSLGVVDSASLPILTDFGTGAMLQASGSYQSGTFSGVTGSLEIMLPVATTAFGLDLATIGIVSGVVLPNNIADLDISINGGTPFNIQTLIRPNLAFAGFISTDPIKSISITASTIQTHAPEQPFRIFADNLILGRAAHSEVPEPSTIFLLASGVGAIAFARMRRS